MPRWNYYKKEQPAPITDLEQRLLKIEGVTEEGEMDTEDVLFLLQGIEKWEETFPYDVPLKQQTPDQLKIQKIKADTQEAVSAYVHRIYDSIKTSPMKFMMKSNMIRLMKSRSGFVSYQKSWIMTSIFREFLHLKN